MLSQDSRDLLKSSSYFLLHTFISSSRFFICSFLSFWGSIYERWNSALLGVAKFSIFVGDVETRLFTSFLLVTTILSINDYNYEFCFIKLFRDSAHLSKDYFKAAISYWYLAFSSYYSWHNWIISLLCVSSSFNQLK